MKKSLVACLLATAILGTTASAAAALNAYLRIAGKNVGKVTGSVTQKGREGLIMVIAAEHQVRSEAGKKTHGVFTITKEVDRSSPLLYKALATSDPLTDFELQFFTPATGAQGGGVERQHYTVRLTGARVVDVKLKMLNNKNPDLMRYAEQEEVSFAYDSITWTYNGPDGPITTTDTR